MDMTAFEELQRKVEKAVDFKGLTERVADVLKASFEQGSKVIILNRNIMEHFPEFVTIRDEPLFSNLGFISEDVEDDSLLYLNKNAREFYESLKREGYYDSKKSIEEQTLMRDYNKEEISS